MIRYTVHYSGRVQGVGFRFTARTLATPFAVAGFVENLADRRVRLVIEGEPDQLDGLLKAIAERMIDYIHDVEVHKSPATGEFGTPGAGHLSIRA
jgi:acylphosphatase